MKKIRRIALFVAAGLTALAACDDFQASDNGKLDGFWQLTQVDTLQSGRSEDVAKRMIFWSVQADLLEMKDLHDMTHAYHGIFFHFSHEGDRLRIYDPVIDNRMISDSIVAEERTLWFYGVYHLEEAFQVLQLEAKKMTLENERLRMYFRKY